MLVNVMQGSFACTIDHGSSVDGSVNIMYDKETHMEGRIDVHGSHSLSGLTFLPDLTGSWVSEVRTGSLQRFVNICQ